MDYAEEHEGYSGKKMILYHQTDQNSAELILVSQRMKKGGVGSAGGIYFAATPEGTNQTGHSQGVILSALVTVGRSKVITDKADLDNFTYTQLQASGYDSVLGKCFVTGNEYVVYNWAQVTDIKIIYSPCPIFAQKWAKVACPYGANCNRTNSDHWSDFTHSGGPSQCQYGNSCYRTDPDHIKQYHPHDYQPKPIPKKSASGTCPYGASCYRQNPDHISLCHPSGFTPALR